MSPRVLIWVASLLALGCGGPEGSMELDGGGASSDDGAIVRDAGMGEGDAATAIDGSTALDGSTVGDAGGAIDGATGDAGALSREPLRVVVIGSSTAEGKNLDIPMYGGRAGGLADRYSSRYERYLVGLFPGSVVENVARAGASTYEVLPTASSTPIPSGLSGPNPMRNITYALSRSPDLIIINFPANRTPSVAQWVANHREVVDAASAAGVPVFVALPNPANVAADIAVQRALRDALLAEFGTQTVDFYGARVGADELSLPATRLSDSAAHPNAEGHRLLFQALVDADLLGAIGHASE